MSKPVLQLLTTFSKELNYSLLAADCQLLAAGHRHVSTKQPGTPPGCLKQPSRSVVLQLIRFGAPGLKTKL
jgi:hypothetical protein